MTRNADGTFAEGNPGRPKGSRNKLSEAYIRELADHFSENGIAAIERVCNKEPDKYLALIGRLMPKLMELSGPDGGEIPLSGTVKFVKSDND